MFKKKKSSCIVAMGSCLDGRGGGGLFFSLRNLTNVHVVLSKYRNVHVGGDIKIPRLKLVTFCRKTSNVCWWSFVDQLHPHHMLGLKVTWGMTASCCYTVLGNVFLLNGGSSHQPSAKA